MKAFKLSQLTLSQKVGTQFPYDWSNPVAMSEDVFVRSVLEKGLTVHCLKILDAYFRSIQFDSALEDLTLVGLKS